jgi:hypothetical protein
MYEQTELDDTMCRALLHSRTGIASIRACRDCGCKACTLVWELTRLPAIRDKTFDLARFGVVERHNSYCSLEVVLCGILNWDIRLFTKSGALRSIIRCVKSKR